MSLAARCLNPLNGVVLLLLAFSTVPAAAAPRDVPIVEIKYFPLDANGNIDAGETGVGGTLAGIRQRVNDISAGAIDALNRGSVYLKDPAAAPSLNYVVLHSTEYLRPVPRSAAFPPYPDHIQLLNDMNVCDYVDNQGVREIWLWMYHTAQIVPIESNMSMGRRSRRFWPQGTYGDVSNSYRQNDLPICENTYTVYDYNYGRGVGEAVHNHGHQLENLFGHADNDLFWNRFVRPYGQTAGVNRCGNVHFPPNGQADYDWGNTLSVTSDCGDWRPEGGGALETVNCNAWGCAGDNQTNYLVWWMKRMPGQNNGLRDGPNTLRNWWDFKADFDGAMAAGRSLYQSYSSPVGSGGVDFAENNAAEWGWADAWNTPATLSDDAASRAWGNASVRVQNAGAGGDAWVFYPKTRDAGWNLTRAAGLHFYLKADNTNDIGWQAPLTVRLVNAGTGQFIEYRYTGALPTWGNFYPYFIPLDGNALWTRTAANAALADIDAVEFHVDTWGTGFTLGLDGVRFDVPPPPSPRNLRRR